MLRKRMKTVWLGTRPCTQFCAVSTICLLQGNSKLPEGFPVLLYQATCCVTCHTYKKQGIDHKLLLMVFYYHALLDFGSDCALTVL